MPLHPHVHLETRDCPPRNLELITQDGSFALRVYFRALTLDAATRRHESGNCYQISALVYQGHPGCGTICLEEDMWRQLNQMIWQIPKVQGDPNFLPSSFTIDLSELF